MTANEWFPRPDVGHNWALVLAAGEGRRLQVLTTTVSGIKVPKQFCSLHGGPSLLHDALRRAAEVAPVERTCVIVAEQHHRWWRNLPESIPGTNVIVQPRNRGTANGILLPLLRIMRRDPEATLAVLPSDHNVRNESTLATGLRRSVQAAASPGNGSVVLLGFTPDEADPELGYLVPDSETDPGVQRVQQFIEKPSTTYARALIGCGGLWNSFIFAARGRLLLKIFEQQCSQIVGQMRRIVEDARDDATGDARLAALYEELPTIDFSRDILERSLPQLRVIAVPACGWSDLGTPRRVGMALASGRPHRSSSAPPAMHAAGFLDLAAQHARMQAEPS